MPSERDKGRWQFSLRTTFVVMFLVASIIVCGRYWHIYYRVPRQPIPWRAFDPDLVQQLREDGEPLLIHFSADWDISTAYIRLGVIETAPVRRAVYELGYTPILVDCSNATADSTRFLQSYGNSQVPRTVIEPGASSTSAIVIDSVFTPEYLVTLLTTARKKLGSSKWPPNPPPRNDGGQGAQ